MTATAFTGGTAASTRRLPSVASGVMEFVWPLYLTLVFTLGAWVLVPTVVLGWQPVTIISGSMAPSVQPGHVVVIEPFTGQELEAGDVVTYRDGDLDRLVTHRIVSVDDDGTMVTRGDANGVDDPQPLTADRVVGVGRLVVPAAGLPSLWVHQGRTDLLAAFAGLSALAAASAASALTTSARSIRGRLRARGDRARRRHMALTGGAVAVVAVLAATTVARAAFVGTEANPDNTFQAGSIAAPTDLTADARCATLGLVTGPEVALSWTAVDGAAHHRVLRSLSDSSGFTEIGTTAGTSFVDADVDLSTTYHYRVQAVSGSWSGPESTTASATTPSLCLL